MDFRWQAMLSNLQHDGTELLKAILQVFPIAVVEFIAFSCLVVLAILVIKKARKQKEVKP